MTQFTIPPDGPFSLEAATHFGFGPNTGRPTYEDAQMKLAFVTDDLHNHALVTLDQRENGDVVGTVESDADTEVVVGQVRRILSLNASGTQWAAVGDEDPVLGAMQREHPGLRPVSFHSPYEAAAWSIISARRQRAQGTVVRNRIAGQLGRVYGDGPDQLFSSPTPERLLELDYVQGLEATKVERLHVVARATLDGQLDAARRRIQLRCPRECCRIRGALEFSLRVVEVTDINRQPCCQDHRQHRDGGDCQYRSLLISYFAARRLKL